MPLGDVIDFVNGFVRKHDIPHVYIGGIAASILGRKRDTFDADVVIFIEPVGVPDLLDALEESGIALGDVRDKLGHQLEIGYPAKFLWDDQFSFDLRLGSVSLDFESLERSVPADGPEGREVVIPPPEEMIVYKLARFSKKDKNDIVGIIQKQKGLDWNRIEALAVELAREAHLPKILENLDSLAALA